MNAASSDYDPKRAFAVCLVYDPAQARSFDEPFSWKSYEDSLTAAHVFADNLRERDDFPGALITVTGNDAATEIRSKHLMASLGFGEQICARCEETKWADKRAGAARAVDDPGETR